MYVADTNNHTIRKIAPGGIVTTFAGLAGTSGNSDGTGSAARFNHPRGVAVDTTGKVYVADSDNHTIRQITPAGVVTTLAGQAGVFGSNDGTGSAARFGKPQAIAVDDTGTLYVADTNNHTIRKITAGGVVTTIAGCSGCIGGENWAVQHAPGYRRECERRPVCRRYAEQHDSNQRPVSRPAWSSLWIRPSSTDSGFVAGRTSGAN